MGILDRLFGGPKRERERTKAKEDYENMILGIMGAHETAKSSGGCPVCPKCAYKFPMSYEQIHNQSQGGLASALCPKCATMLKL